MHKPFILEHSATRRQTPSEQCMWEMSDQESVPEQIPKKQQDTSFQNM
jgi:hypothetical protein